jgi:hypothetical protein
MPKKMYDEDEEEEAESEEQSVGPCKNCQFFDIDRTDDEAGDDVLAPCLHPDLEEYELVVSGDSGCNLFEPYEGGDEEEEEEEEEDEEEEEEY